MSVYNEDRVRLMCGCSYTSSPTDGVRWEFCGQCERSQAEKPQQDPTDAP
jgi:hypothetical protein